MNVKTTSNRTATLVILNLLTLAWFLYVLSVYMARPVFQQAQYTDPLAEIHSLSPLFYLSLVITALSGVGCLIWRLGNKYLHLLILSMFAVMLWLTPYLLAGFTRTPDAPWHLGIAMQMPQVLAGVPIAFSKYARFYPGSYIFHYSFVTITGLRPLTYMQFYPPVCLFLFVLLCYVLIGKVFDRSVAFLSLLFAIPGLHYVQIHASPHTIGALLMLTALLLLTLPGLAARALSVPVIIAIIISHPATPLLLSIFLASVLVTTFMYSRRISRPWMIFAVVMVACFIGWLSLYSRYIQPEAASPFVTSTIKSATSGSSQGIINQIFPSDFSTAGDYIAGTAFIFGNIFNLNKGIYLLYAVAAISSIMAVLAKSYSSKPSIRDWIAGVAGVLQQEAFLICAVPVFLVLIFLLAAQAHDLIETGLTYIILDISVIFASMSLRFHWFANLKGFSLLVAGVLFVTLTFPIVAYSIDAYTSFPASEAAGLRFLAGDLSLSGKNVAGAFLDQIELFNPQFTNNPVFLELSQLKEEPDIAVFRHSYYYYSAMRFDMSFTRNAYSENLARVQSIGYDQVYSDPTFIIYSKPVTP